MTISIWRYSHFLLAISSSVFLLIASLTGIILAFESVDEKLHSYYISESESLSIAETLNNLNSVYPEILSLKKDRNNFISINTVIDGKNASFYINPFTGKRLGNIIEKKPIYQFATSLHRSLFLKKTGRLLVGVTSFLLLIIAFTGVVIIAKRQGGYTRFFSKIVKENFNQYNHVVLSRWGLIPLILIAISGVYLSFLRFNVIEEDKVNYNIDFDTIKNTPKVDCIQFDVFKTNKLADLKSLDFPFSDFIEDYFHLKLVNKELVVNQFTGETLSEFRNSNTTIISHYMSVIHTGSHSIFWAVILGIAMFLLVFLMYSGFYMYIKRPKTIVKNKYAKDDCTHIILVGSEGKSTLKYACLLHEQLLGMGIHSFLAELNAYSTYEKMKQLVVLTATYGVGEAPSNASKFLALFSYVKQKQPFSFSVVGFGSTAYPDFCKFAYVIENALFKNKNAEPLTPIQTVNNQSFEAFSQWANLWSGEQNIVLELDKSKIENGLKPKIKEFKIISNSFSEATVDGTFLLQLAPKKGSRYNSGDLLAIYPENEKRERLYSISKMNDRSILMSVKKHEFGVCSTYMSSIKKGTSLKGYIVKNNSFYFPKKATQVMMIATGTGIGPFLGMLENNTKKVEVNLYWGTQTDESYKLYQNVIEQSLKEQKLNQFIPVYSRASVQKIYVQDVIKKDAEKIANLLDSGGVIMLCGSVVMQKQVLKTLDTICIEKLEEKLSFYQNRSQIKMDCY